MQGVAGDTHSSDSTGLTAWGWCRAGLSLCLLCAWWGLVKIPEAGWLSAASAQTRELNTDRLESNEPLLSVEIEGNVTIPTSAVAKYVKVQPGRPATPSQIREDVRSLYATRWFLSVEPRLRRTPAGLVLVFEVLERPIVRRVEYRGNKKIKTKYLEALTGLKPDSPFDPRANKEAAQRIEAHYHEKGYPFATVELAKGGGKDDREVIFDINEGPKTKVTRVKFTGNKFFSGSLLKTKLRTKTAFLWLLGGGYDPATIPNDIAALKQYYQDLGFFDVKIDHKVHFSKNRSWAQIEYIITEGDRYKLGRLELLGNQIFQDEELRKDLKLAAGEFFTARKMRQDVEGMKEKYGRLGRLFARVEAVPRFLEKPGVVDLIYQIDEDRVYRIRRVNVHIQGDNPHTKERVVHNRILFASGDLANPKKIRRSERRLAGHLFERDPARAPRISLTPVPDKEAPRPIEVVRGQNFEGPLPEPANPMYDNSPQGDPFGQALREPPPGWVDANVYVNEARTGRLMFGVGVNSDAGVVGTIVLDESNFDILRPPRSFQDIIDGTAWRGGGQRFRIEAVPGNVVSRYMISWTDPYFLDTDYSLGVSGFYYKRFFPDWDEQRGGGRISVGKQWTQEISTSAALRLEEVTIENPDRPTPSILAESVGSNYLSTFRAAVSHDTRDSSFLPAEGHFAQLSYEQAFGDFSYPRFEAEARQYFTIYSRPDGGGRHTLMIGGELGWTDKGTPIFERFYGGGYQTFRGFEFRGVGPRESGVEIGGRWLALATAEYRIPLTADDNIALVFFSDVGTVEEDPGFDAFRVSVGTGLRLTVPAMGPVPLAFDFAIPITREDFDETRVFSFYIGINR